MDGQSEEKGTVNNSLLDKPKLADKPKHTMGDATKNRRVIGLLRILIILLCVAVLALIIAFAVVAVQLHKKIDSLAGSCDTGSQEMNLNPPLIVPPFHDLTQKEILNVKEFLYSKPDLNLSRPPSLQINNSYIYTMEVQIPNKEQTLNYLDKGKEQPPREAKVYIFRGDLPEPYIEEYIVGPLPNPLYKKSHVTHPFRLRPLTGPELVGVIEFITQKVHASCSKIVEESYGGKLKDCGDKCLEFQFLNPFTPAVSGYPRTRKFWFWLLPVVEYANSHPLDFHVLVDVTSRHVEEFVIDKVFHAEETFNSLEELAKSYESGSFQKTNIKFPIMDNNLYSTLHRRGTLFPSAPLSPPIEYEPDGHRYSINGRHISYMGWDFNLRMSTISGPQLFDIRYQNERIVYELSLQEISVLYSAHSPANRFSDFFDSIGLIGSRSRSLVEGADCPKHATYLSVDHVLENSADPVRYDRAFCVFEHNTGKPLRRHLTSHFNKHQFYEGMMDIVLVVRTIPTVYNYDYIFDFIFHQNGAVEVKAVSTGYILTAFKAPSEQPYGFNLRDHVVGPIHHHLFSFKADIDIKGKTNRFEVLDIEQVQVDNSQWSVQPNAKYSQTKFTQRHVRNEKEAAIKYNFDTPNYLTFYNHSHRSSTGVPRAYRLVMKGMSKQLVAENQGNEPAASWARYQLAVTKHKENEPRSSSMYASWDADAQVVNFQGFIDDDDNIVDEDQVAWITMGLHHIPHMEDFPVTPTVGLDLQFFLLPYNYFDEDPGMGSSDAVRIDPRTTYNVKDGVRVNRYGKSDGQCAPPASTFDESVNNNPESLFDATP